MAHAEVQESYSESLDCEWRKELATELRAVAEDEVVKSADAEGEGAA